jgi:hypothetical protein
MFINVVHFLIITRRKPFSLNVVQEVVEVAVVGGGYFVPSSYDMVRSATPTAK